MLFKSIQTILKENTSVKDENVNLKQEIEKANKSLIDVSELTKNYASLDKELKQTREGVREKQLKIDELLFEQESNIRLIESLQTDKTKLFNESERLKDLVKENQKEISLSLMKIADLEGKLEENEPKTKEYTENLVTQIESSKRKLSKLKLTRRKKSPKLNGSQAHFC